jgi:Resolvase, N terminal domain
MSTQQQPAPRWQCGDRAPGRQAANASTARTHPAGAGTLRNSIGSARATCWSCETRPALALIAGRADGYGAAGRSQSRVPGLTEAIDTTTPAGRMMVQMVGSFAEFERASCGSARRLVWRRPAEKGVLADARRT